MKKKKGKKLEKPLIKTDLSVLKLAKLFHMQFALHRKIIGLVTIFGQAVAHIISAYRQKEYPAFRRTLNFSKYADNIIDYQKI